MIIMAVVCSHYSERLPLAVILMIRSSNCHLFWRRYPTDISSRVVDYMHGSAILSSWSYNVHSQKILFSERHDLRHKLLHVHMYTQIENFKRVDRHWQGGVMLFCVSNILYKIIFDLLSILSLNKLHSFFLWFFADASEMTWCMRISEHQDSCSSCVVWWV